MIHWPRSWPATGSEWCPVVHVGIGIGKDLFSLRGSLIVIPGARHFPPAAIGLERDRSARRNGLQLGLVAPAGL